MSAYPLSSDDMNAECARIMALTDDEINAELRAEGLDPDEVAEKGRQAVVDALLEVRIFKATNASLEIELQTDGQHLLRLCVEHASFGICRPRGFMEAMSLKFAFRRALLTLLNAAKEVGRQEASPALLEREAQFGREMEQRRQELMRRIREEHHQLTYADLVALGR